MLYLFAGHRRALAIAAVAVALASCNTRTFFREGDANSVEVGYFGDVETAMPVALKHCARFERVPRLVQTGIDVAVFDCVAR
jgi:hypothetical protein